MKKIIFREGWRQGSIRRLTAAWLMLCMLAAFALPFAGGQALAEEAGSKPLEGKYMSVLGDSISTYTGWSDAYPIADESCTYRYGEAFYGPAGGDFHNTDLLVTDTWWHQAATELGAQILMSNASNSTGLLFPRTANGEVWAQWTTELLAWKSRPYYLGRNGIDPDVIALYIGSNEISFTSRVSEYGTLEDVDFDALIQPDGNGGYTYATPVTVAEAYCILLHKISVTYPDAEVYCFACVPNSSAGKVAKLNSLLPAANQFNAMMRDVAAHYGAIVVDLMDAFQLDPDGDGVATEEAVAAFAACYNGDPHPNAAGFDVITDCFVKAVRANSKYRTAVVESAAGLLEEIPVTADTDTRDGVTTIVTGAENYRTPGNLIVSYQGEENIAANDDVSFREHYTSAAGNYTAEGGREGSIIHTAPVLKVNIPLAAEDDPATPQDETKATVAGDGSMIPVPSGDVKISPQDGVYSYNVTVVDNSGAAAVQTAALSYSRVKAETPSRLQFVYNPTKPAPGNGMISRTENQYVQVPRNPEIAEGYDYVYVGSDQFSNYYAAYQFSDPAMDHANQGPIYADENAALYLDVKKSVFVNYNPPLLVPYLHLKTGTVGGNDKYPAPFPARWESIQQFVVADTQGNAATTYCADQVTPAQEGFSYIMHNVEDGTYYSTEPAQMIRTVAKNGYWGTESGFGSMENLRQMMADSGKFSEEDIAALTDGMAMTATQYAVWTFSNETDDHVYTSAFFTNRTGGVDGQAPEEDVDLLMRLYHYLISLPPTVIAPDDAATNNTIINEKNFLRNIDVQLVEKAAHAANADDDSSNDVYLADITFRLKVKPVARTVGQQPDSLLMTITTEDGREIKGRISGELKDGEIQLYPDGNDMYTFSGVQLSEGMQNIRFALTGWQTLDKDVYLYTSEVKEGESSQTMVGVAEGLTGVGVTLSLDFELDVKDNVTTRERIWRTERWLTTPPPPATPTPEPTPGIDIPETGDHAAPGLWLMLLGVTGLLMAGLLTQRKKNMA